jgi:tetratricopeptide (TPR) repeat protein
MRTGLIPSSAPLFVACLFTFAVLEAQTPTGWQDMVQEARQQLQQGNYQMAYQTLSSALALAQSNGAHPSLEATTRNNLGDITRALGQYIEAERHFKGSIALWEKLGRDGLEGLSRPLNNLALLYLDTGRLSDAARVYLRALAIRTELKGPRHPDLAPSLIGLCNIEGQQRRFSEGEAHCHAAIEVLQNGGQIGNPTLAMAYMNLAVLYAARNDLATASRLTTKAVELAHLAEGFRHADLIKLLLAAAKTRSETGSPTQAVETLEQAMTMAKAYLGTQHPTFARGLLLRAKFLRKDNRNAEARKLEQQAATILGRNRRENLLDHSVDVSEFQAGRK